MARRAPRLCLVASNGGHLAQLVALRPFWADYERFWVSFRTPDAVSVLEGEETYWCAHPTNRSVRALVRNTVIAARLLRVKRPTHIISTGAGPAVPFFYVGRLVGSRLMFIEVFDRVSRPTLTARLVAPIADDMLVQWPEQLRFFRAAELLGPLL